MKESKLCASAGTVKEASAVAVEGPVLEASKTGIEKAHDTDGVAFRDKVIIIILFIVDDVGFTELILVLFSVDMLSVINGLVQRHQGAMIKLQRTRWSTGSEASPAAADGTRSSPELLLPGSGYDRSLPSAYAPRHR